VAHYRLIKFDTERYYKEVTLEKVPSPIALFFGAKTKVVKFRNFDGLWREVSTGRSVSLSMDERIRDIVAGYMIHRNEYHQ
jgi:hypothetical protein